MRYPKNYVVYDFETTGLDTNTCEVVEIGAVKVQDGQVSNFETLVKMRGEMNPDAERTHGITKDLANSGMEVNDAVRRLVEFVGHLPLVGHNIVRYDNLILSRLLASTGILPGPGSPRDPALVWEPIARCVDTMALFRARLTGDGQRWHENHLDFAVRMGEVRVKSSLALAASNLGVETHGMTLHRAAADVELCRQVYEKLIA